MADEANIPATPVPEPAHWDWLMADLERALAVAGVRADGPDIARARAPDAEQRRSQVRLDDLPGRRLVAAAGGEREAESCRKQGRRAQRRRRSWPCGTFTESSTPPGDGRRTPR